MLSSFSMALVPRIWGESVIWMMVMSGLVLNVSSDSLTWKSGLLGEMDYIGWCLSLLSVWVVMLAVVSSEKVKKLSFLRFFFVCISVSLLSVFMVSFYVSEFLFFYIGFEMCLIPIFIMILGWGYQPERAQAGIYMLFYTLFGSLPLFFLILDMTSKGCGYMYSYYLVTPNSVFSLVFLVSAFLVKFPMFSLHLWLLKAHVEAPVAGSMILAGVMLKLGGYGLMRFLAVWPSSFELMKEMVVCLSVWGGLVVGLSCLRQMDMKLLIASSSVVHMSMCISGLFILSEWGFKGTLAVMMGHGLCSSGLFYLANVVYERTSSRSMVVSKGLLSLMPSLCLSWFVLLGANMSAPPSMNLLGEILLISTLVSWSKWSMVIVGFLCFFSASYSLYLFSLSQHGVYLMSKSGFNSGRVVEYLVSSAHFVPLNIMILCVFCIMY